MSDRKMLYHSSKWGVSSLNKLADLFIKHVWEDLNVSDILPVVEEFIKWSNKKWVNGADKGFYFCFDF